MSKTHLQLKRALRAALLVLLLSVVGMTNAKAQSNAPTGAINGLFAINGNGDQVYFSQGNLQYIGSASTPYWKFVEHQWDYLGTTTGQDSDNPNVDRDLFAWGTSGHDHGAVCYQPWSTGHDSYYYAYGNWQANLFDQTGEADWGSNAISNGGNQANQWRTLTRPEWDYVFNTRTTSSGIRYAKAEVNNVNGVILLPDDWDSDTYSLSNTNTYDASFSSNTITASQWNTLEQHGAVFLPAARFRSVNGVGSSGCYWSASYSNSYLACRVLFDDSNLRTDYDYYRADRFSVRLVRPASTNTSYFIEAIPNPAGGGTISGAGTYDYYSQVTLTASANEGYTFYQWKENGNMVSTENPYSFVAFFDRNLEAVFLENSTYPLLYSYNDGDHTATVIGRWDGVELTGELVIPETVMHNGETYTVMAIGDWAFNGCYGLTSVILSDSLVSIGFAAFEGCSGLASIVFPNTLVSISERAFMGCGLTEVVIPKSVDLIGTNPFQMCSNIEQITVDFENPYYDSRGNCNAIIETNTNHLVAGCENTIIPNTVTTIENCAFMDCAGLTSIVIPASVSSIGFWAFRATGLTMMTVEATTPPELSYVDPWHSTFGGVSLDIPIYIPCGTLEAYQNAEVWSRFTNFIEMCPGTITVTANHEEYGTVSGGGSFEAGEICTVTATPYEGYYFLCWMEDGQVVSTEATYTFPVYRDHNLTGIFYVSLGDENIINGDFEQGNVGFTSDYEYADFLSEGMYNVDSNVYVHHPDFVGVGHGGLGSFMIINGAMEPGVNVWTEQITVSPNTYYAFSTWVCTLVAQSEASLQFSINGSPIGVCTAPSQTNTWKQFITTWYSGDSTTATITIVDLNTEGSGNDFGLDDISFRELFVEIPLHWTPNTIDYEENMPVTAVVEIDGVEQQSTTLELGAFSGEECRGSQMAMYFEPTQRYIYQMTVFGEEGDEITFRLYDHATNEELDLVAPEAIVFDAFGYGNLPNPIVLNFRHSYDITTSANPTEGGTVEGGGTYLHGDVCTLTATPNTNYVFVNWTLDGEVVSTEAEYSFEVIGGGDYVARFDLVQTTNFSQGWNWWSTYIEQEGTEGLEALENGLGANGSIVKAQNEGYVSYLEGYGWYGSLERLYNEQSYRVQANAACVVPLQGLPTNPADHPITLNPGWTWMGFPWNQAMSVEAALEGFEPEANDFIKGRNAYTMYYAENGYSMWFGPLNSLEPGQGYVYYSNSGEAKTLTLNTNDGRSAQPNVTASDNLFHPEAGNYADNMTLTAVVDFGGAELRSEDYEVAAFCNGECRGSAKLTYFAPTDSYIAFLTLYGNDGDELEFVLTDGDMTTLSGSTLRFATDGRIGTLSEPYPLCFGFTGLDDNAANRVSVYPNPSRDVFNIKGEGIRRIDVFNAFGQVVFSAETSNDTFQVDLSDKATGVYLLRVVTESGVTNQQLIKE